MSDIQVSPSAAMGAASAFETATSVDQGRAQAAGAARVTGRPFEMTITGTEGVTDGTVLVAHGEDLESLQAAIQQQLGLPKPIRLMIFDAEFEEFCRPSPGAWADEIDAASAVKLQ